MPHFSLISFDLWLFRLSKQVENSFQLHHKTSIAAFNTGSFDTQNWFHINVHQNECLAMAINRYVWNNFEFSKSPCRKSRPAALKMCQADMRQANSFPKTDLDLNNLQGTFDVVPGSENKIGNNFHGVSVPELPWAGSEGCSDRKHEWGLWMGSEEQRGDHFLRLEKGNDPRKSSVVSQVCASEVLSVYESLCMLTWLQIPTSWKRSPRIHRNGIRWRQHETVRSCWHF